MAGIGHLLVVAAAAGAEDPQNGAADGIGPQLDGGVDGNRVGVVIAQIGAGEAFSHPQQTG